MSDGEFINVLAVLLRVDGGCTSCAVRAIDDFVQTTQFDDLRALHMLRTIGDAPSTDRDGNPLYAANAQTVASHLDQKRIERECHSGGRRR